MVIMKMLISVDESKKFKKSFNASWFDVLPEWMIFSHLPDEEDWQLLDIPISEEEYSGLPNIRPMFFHLGFNIKGMVIKRICISSQRLARRR